MRSTNQQQSTRPKTPTRQGGAQLDNGKGGNTQKNMGAGASQGKSSQGNNKNLPFSMYSAREAREVHLNIMGARFYGDTPTELSKISTKGFPRLIKETQEECRVDKSVMVRDLSLKVKAHEEDEAFAANPELWLNFRRGNTLLELYDPVDYNRLLNIVVARKGLTKFFDIKHDFISKDARYREDYLDNYDQLVKNLTFAPVKRAMLEGHKVEAIKMLKANGENCQVSYVPDIDAWVIASKNVGLVARTIEDVDLYTRKNAIRYSYATLMANCWFQLISQFATKDMEALKKDFANRTFVGEYIGNPACQHLVKYPRESIVFYAVIDNYSRRICRLPEEAFVLLKKYKLDSVNIDSMGLYNDYDHLCDDLQLEFEKVSGLSIQVEEEGAVIYFVLRHNEDSGKDQVLSLGKLKTLEYRLFRKMREKLRNFVNKISQSTQERSIQRYISESRELCRDPSGKEFNLPHPLNYYIDLCVLAFELITRGQQKDINYFTELLLNEYVHFLEEVISVFEERNRGSKKIYVGTVSFDSKVLDNQEAINYTGPPGQKNRVINKTIQQATGPVPTKVVTRVLIQEQEVQETPTPQPQPTSTRVAKFAEVPPTPTIVVRNVQAVPPSAPLGNNLVIIAPAFTFTYPVFEQLTAELGGLQANLIVTDTYSPDLFKQAEDNQHVNLILLNSLKGLATEKMQSHTEKIYYFVVNFTHEQLSELKACDDIERLSRERYQGHGDFKSLDELDRYVDSELQMLEKDKALERLLKSARNVEVINTTNMEKDMLSKVNWASYRLKPVQVVPAKPQAAATSEASSSNATPQQTRKVQMAAATQEQQPHSVLKKPIEVPVPTRQVIAENRSAANRAESGSKKRVKISDVVEYEPSGPSRVLSGQKQLYMPKGETPVAFANQRSMKATQRKQIIILMPMGIPGMGKTTFIETQLKPMFDGTDIKFSSFASDQIRKELVDEENEKNRRAGIKKSKDQVFQDTGRLAVQVFLQILEQHIYDAIEDNQYSHHVICLDKNHPPQALNSTIENVNKFVNGYKGNRDFDLFKVAMVPQMADPKSLYMDFPFSLSFLFQCFIRCLDRNDHETLTNSDPSLLARVQVSFFKAYKGLHFAGEDGRNFLFRTGLDDLVAAPLTLEHPDLELPYNVEHCIDKCLKLTTGFGPANPHEEFDRLVHLGNLYKAFFNGLTKVPEFSQSGRKINNNLQEINYLLQRCFNMNLNQIKSSIPHQAPPVSEIRKVHASAPQQQVISAPPKEEQRRQVVQTAVQQQPVYHSNLITVREVTHQAPQPKVIYKPIETESRVIVKHNISEEEVKTTPSMPPQPKENSVIAQQVNPTRSTNGGVGPDDLGFETKVLRKGKVNRKNSDDDSEDEDDGRIPLYLGISLHHDAKIMMKLREILTKGMQPLLDDFKSSLIESTLDSLKAIWINGQKDANGWKKPDDYHVTTYFVGKDEDKTSHDLYQNHEDDIEVTVEILALIIVPNKIVTGICFPDYQVANRCPHVTLMVNEWKPVMSNNLLESACAKGASSPFQEQYSELKEFGSLQQSDQLVFHGQAKVDLKGPTSSCYLVVLPEAVEFQGITKTYY